MLLLHQIEYDGSDTRIKTKILDGLRRILSADDPLSHLR